MVKLAAILLLTSAPVMANEAPVASTGPQPQQTASDQSKIICKKATATGTRTRAKKICGTAHQWKAANEELQKDMLKAGSSRGRPS